MVDLRGFPSLEMFTLVIWYYYIFYIVHMSKKNYIYIYCSRNKIVFQDVQISYLPLLLSCMQRFVLQDPHSPKTSWNHATACVHNENNCFTKCIGPESLYVDRIFIATTVHRRRPAWKPWLSESCEHTWETNKRRPIGVDPGRLSIESLRMRVVHGV